MRSFVSAVVRSSVSIPAFGASQVACVLACASGFLDRVFADLRSDSPSLTLGLSPLELLVVVLAARTIQTLGQKRFSQRHLVLALALAVPSGATAWIALAVFASYEAWRARAGERMGFVLFVGLAVCELWMTVGFKSLAPMLLPLDAAMAAAGLRVAGFATQVTNNVVEVAGGNSIVVLVTCATFHRMPLALLAAVALAPAVSPRPLIAMCLTVAICYFALNLARLVAMGWSPEAYAFMHDGTGASLYDAAQTMLVFLVAMRFSR